MIDFKQFTLENGLDIYVYEDDATPLAAVNILYKVGSRDEDENKTGFAHLFEHLMFGGSQNIKSYDGPLQNVGGVFNAFTNPDITNYYIILPAINLETAFWLESDRMLGLSFDPQVLETQRKVVIEEFKQRYLNQPYGDAWLKLRPLAYTTHPYKWPTIGKEISHIEKVNMDDVKAFSDRFYAPNNAIMVVAGNVTFDKVSALAEKWFGPVKRKEKYQHQLPVEPVQKEERVEEITADVPLNALYKAFHMPGRTEEGYHAVDLLSDVLGRGKSSILYEHLVKDTEYFNHITAYITGSADPGLLIIDGKLNEGISFEDADYEINKLLENIIKAGVSDETMEKVKNQAESSLILSEAELSHSAMKLAYAAFLGNPDLVNEEANLIRSVTSEQVKSLAKDIMTPENSSTLFYKVRK